MKKVKQSDIARLSGVSISTVSRVLNGVPGISSDVRSQVGQAAASLGYSIPSADATPRAARSVLVLSPLTFLAAQAGQFHIDILQGIADATRERGVALTCAPLGDESEMLKSLAGLDGLLLLSLDSTVAVALADAAGVPIGLVNTDDHADRHDVSMPDNRGGSAKAARHLLELGHRDILYIAHSDRDTIRHRVEGFRDAVAGGEVRFRTARLDYAQPINDFADALQGYRAESPFTAVACSNDITALAAVQALSRLGLSVPRDVSVTGFDDLPMAVLSNPTLTTISIDRKLLGEIALKRLLDRIAAPEGPALRQIISTRLIKRGSTAAVSS